jgi:hypothetical protein
MDVIVENMRVSVTLSNHLIEDSDAFLILEVLRVSNDFIIVGSRVLKSLLVPSKVSVMLLEVLLIMLIASKETSWVDSEIHISKEVEQISADLLDVVKLVLSVPMKVLVDLSFCLNFTSARGSWLVDDTCRVALLCNDLLDSLRDHTFIHRLLTESKGKNVMEDWGWIRLDHILISEEVDWY